MPDSRDILQSYRDLAKVAEAEARRSESRRRGATRTNAQIYQDATEEALLPREDNSSLEVCQWVLIQARRRFANDSVLTWVGRSDGHTDLAKSKIIIQSVMADHPDGDRADLPSLSIRPGPSAAMPTGSSTVRHQSFPLGQAYETHTGVDATSVQILVRHPVPISALRVANLVRKWLKVNAREIAGRRILSISDATVGGYEKGNALYNVSIAGANHAIVPVTFTALYQWTAESSAQGGLYEKALSVRQSLGIGPEGPTSQRIESEMSLYDRDLPVAGPAFDDEEE